MIYTITTEDGKGIIPMLKEITKSELIIFRMSMVDETDIDHLFNVINGNDLILFDDMDRATEFVKKNVEKRLKEIDTTNKTIIINNVIQYENTI